MKDTTRLGSTVPSKSMRPTSIHEESGPLGFLDRLLDEERDSNLHFGDVRFWQHIEHIDTVRIYRLRSLEYRTMKLMFCEALFFAFFLCFLSGFIVNIRAGSLYESRQQQLDYWGGCHRSKSSGLTSQRSCTLDSVRDAASLMTWLETDFVPRAFTFQHIYPSLVGASSIYRLQAGTMHWIPRYVGDTQTSVLLGKIRLRQLRVQYNKECQILSELQAIHTDCFPAFKKHVQSKLPWAPSFTPTYLMEHFEWHPANWTQQRPMSGRHGHYPGDGFVLDVPLNLTGARRRIKELAEWQWMDHRTRAFIVELNTLNPNVNSFVNTRILFEFPPTGGLIVSQDAFAFKAYQMSLPLMSGDDFGGVFLFFALTSGMHALLLAYATFLIVKNGFRYFTYVWSIVDLAILLLFSIYVCTNIVIFTEAAWEPSLQPEIIADSEVFFPIGNVVSSLEAGNRALALLGLISWIKVLKYFSLSSTFHPLVRVLERCLVNLLKFAALFLIVLFGFAVALHISYGDETNLFSSVGGSFFAVIVAPAGGVELQPIFDMDDLLGPVLIFAYIVVVFLLLLNTFMAICVETYTVATFQIDDHVSSRPPNLGGPASIFLWTYWSALKGVKLVGKETLDEIGEPDEQQIKLTSLPEDIQLRYTKTKSFMEQLLASVEVQTGTKRRQLMLAQGAFRDQALNPSQNSAPLALQDDQGGLRALAIKDSAPPPPPIAAQNPPPPSGEPTGIMVRRVQLQRMLDEDPILVEICGTSRAIDIIRRFRVDQSGVDPYAAIADLQSNVARKLEELEEQGMDLSFDELETLRQVSTELHAALTEAQREWRSELLTVMQMASLLSHSLVELTRRLEAIQINHNNFTTRAGAG